MMSKDIKQVENNVNEISDKFARNITSEFITLLEKLKSEDFKDQTVGRLEKLYKSVVSQNNKMMQELKDLLKMIYQRDNRLKDLQNENKKLETLYISGIQFSSETEMENLMRKAIDTVIKELEADAGFIILSDESGEIESIYARNINPEEQPEAKEMSMSVIRNTLSSREPKHIDDLESYIDDSKKGSILRLGIKSVLCVPLLTEKTVLGAVYLDRRNSHNCFKENDLLFLISFARLIVQGIEISHEFSSLETKLLQELQMKFDDLREEFKCEEIMGSSKILFDSLLLASKTAHTDVPIIILGENGTGKELLARAIHENSPRASQPFVTINCSAIPKDLLESELFGYETGAFTGATKPKSGKIEMADGGTLFLDEIGELEINLQAKLLRVLQTHEIEKIGSVVPKIINVRVLAATNQDLEEMVYRGKFRQDLYYRLKVIKIIMPPLRDRREDIPELVSHFLRKHAGQKEELSISPEAMEVLENYSWPGNIRELENVILRGIVLTHGNRINTSDLPPELIDSDIPVKRIKPGKPLSEAETEFRRRYILRTLQQTSSKKEAAKLLGINRTHFYRMLAQLGIE